jgi:hypothetical protein
MLTRRLSVRGRIEKYFPIAAPVSSKLTSRSKDARPRSKILSKKRQPFTVRLERVTGLF